MMLKEAMELSFHLKKLTDRSVEDKTPRMDIKDQESQKQDNLGSNVLI